jgi:hypothetical protein
MAVCNELYRDRLYIYRDYVQYCTVAQLIKLLPYKPEDHRFDSQWCHWNFLLTQSFRPRCHPGVNSTSNRNEQEKYLVSGGG